MRVKNVFESRTFFASTSCRVESSKCLCPGSRAAKGAAERFSVVRVSGTDHPPKTLSGYGSSRKSAWPGPLAGEGFASVPPAASALGQWPTWQTKPEGDGLFTID